MNLNLEEKIKKITDSVHNRFQEDKEILSVLDSEAIITVIMKKGKLVLDNIKYSNHGSLLLTSNGIYYFPIFHSTKKILSVDSWEEYYS